MLLLNAAGAVLGMLRARRRLSKPSVPPGVYFRTGSNLWVYVPPGAPVVPGQHGRNSWLVQVVVVDPSVSSNQLAKAYRALYATIDLRPASALHVSFDLQDKIARRANDLLATTLPEPAGAALPLPPRSAGAALPQRRHA